MEANQNAPSGPAAMEMASDAGNSVAAPAGVIRPMLPPRDPANHRLLSGPAAMPYG